MAESFDYRKAFEQVKNDLKDFLEERENLDRKIMNARKTLEALETTCESEGIDIDPSAEAVFLLGSSTLSDQVLEILRHEYPAWNRATMIRHTLEQLGHDLKKYTNPLATIHMICKRHVEAEKAESGRNKQGEKQYRAVMPLKNRSTKK